LLCSVCFSNLDCISFVIIHVGFQICVDTDGDVAKEDFPSDGRAWYQARQDKVFSMINYSLDRLQRDVTRQLQRMNQHTTTSIPTIPSSSSSAWGEYQDNTAMDWEATTMQQPAEEFSTTVFEANEDDQ
jgi:hypothetical protein